MKIEKKVALGFTLVTVEDDNGNKIASITIKGETSDDDKIKKEVSYHLERLKKFIESDFDKEVAKELGYTELKIF